MPRSLPAVSAPFCTTSQKASPAEPCVITEKLRSPPEPPPFELLPPESLLSVVQPASTSGTAAAIASRRWCRAMGVLLSSGGHRRPRLFLAESCLPWRPGRARTRADGREVTESGDILGAN